jgi:hypothetical protein
MLFGISIFRLKMEAPMAGQSSHGWLRMESQWLAMLGQRRKAMN